jgi:hypothetical protein
VNGGTERADLAAWAESQLPRLAEDGYAAILDRPLFREPGARAAYAWRLRPAV